MGSDDYDLTNVRITMDDLPLQLIAQARGAAKKLRDPGCAPRSRLDTLIDSLVDEIEKLRSENMNLRKVLKNG